MTAPAASQLPRRPAAWLVNLALAAVAVLLAVSIESRVGRASEVAGSLDGHARIRGAVTTGLAEADAVTRGRPLVPLLAWAAGRPASPLRAPLLRLAQLLDPPGDETVRLFTALNLLFTGLLAVAVSLLLDATGVSSGLKVVAVLNLFATLALARVPAYQPEQMHLGASVFVTLAVYAVTRQSRAWIAVTHILAVLAGAPGLAAVLFGVSRDRQQGVSSGRSMATYLPAVLVFGVVQVWAYEGAPQGSGVLGVLGDLPLVANPALVGQLAYVLPATWGVVTIFGGVSLVLLARAFAGRVGWAVERSWAHYLIALGAASFVAGMGAWTALAYMLPAAAVLFAHACADDDWRLVALATSLATLATQHTWAPLSDGQYLAAVSPWLLSARDTFERVPHEGVMWAARILFVTWFAWWAGRDLQRRLHVALGVTAAVLLLTLSDLSGAITANGGYGFDGEYYVRMMQGGFEQGTPSTRLRPLMVALMGALDRAVFHDPIAAFRAVNLAFAGLLAVVLVDLSRRYGAPWPAAAVLIVNLFLAISTAKLFAFYPTLVDLGALTFMTAAVWAVVADQRVLAAVAIPVAVASREFAAVVVLFGVVRDLRLRRPWAQIIATYAPGLVAFWAVRQFAASFAAEAGSSDILSIGGLVSALLQNLRWWADPAYGSFWLYFAVTLFGGLSLAVLMSRTAWLACVRREPEWLAIVVPMVAVTAVGYLDMWRYLVFLLPALVPLWAWCVEGVPPRRQTLFFVCVTAATLLTQRPWQFMDLDSYFRDWFPYYLIIEDRATAGAELWPAWRFHLFALVASVALLATSRLWTRRAEAGHTRG